MFHPAYLLVVLLLACFTSYLLFQFDSFLRLLPQLLIFAGLGAIWLPS
jgi:hypothetical protein